MDPFYQFVGMNMNFNMNMNMNMNEGISQEMEILAAVFVGNLMAETPENVTCLVMWDDAATLDAALLNIESTLMASNTPDQEVSQNILYAILGVLQRETLAMEPNLMRRVSNLLYSICQSFHSARAELIRIGVVGIACDIMKKEIEYLTNLQDLKDVNNFIISAQVISPFFPVLSFQDYKDMNNTSRNILYRGPPPQNSTASEITGLMKAAFPTLYGLCQTPKCPTIYYTLLLKMIHWANEANILTSFVPVKELIDFAKILMSTEPIHKDTMVIGFAIVNVIYHKHFNCLRRENIFEFLKEKLPIISAWPKETRYNWVFQMYNVLITFWLSKKTSSEFQIDEENYNSRLGRLNLVFNSLRLETSKMSLEDSYASLRELVTSTLILPDMSRHKGNVTLRSEGINEFKELVKFVLNSIETELIRFDYIKIKPDLIDPDESNTVPAAPADISLDLYRSPSFNRVLGASKSPDELSSNSLVRALRLLSILYEVNESWGVLFGTLSTERIIDRNYFVSGVLKEVMKNIQSKTYNRFNKVPIFVIEIAGNYSFLLTMTSRQYVSRCDLRACAGANVDCITQPKMAGHVFNVPRENLLNGVTENLDSMASFANKIWKFQFLNELGTGEGPTKEFYSEFAHDCQRYDIDLWNGEPGEAVDGISYVHSQCGLFPSPKANAEIKASHLKAIGMVMGKAVLDNHLMDINFSNAFYKCLFKKNLEAQQLSLIDIKDVMPSIFKFVESLVDALKQKSIIKNDNSLTTEEQNQAINNLTCDGCPFEDLCINFTLPGHPDIEMKEGGRDTLLNIDNVEEYLKLLVWWLLYKNPQEIIKQISNEFSNIMKPRFMRYFYPHEYEQVLCGLKTENWTVDYLKRNCVLERLTLDTPVVQYLFEVLSSLSVNDQRDFLQFLTGAPRLPVGGLAYLKPRLTIQLRGADGNPDIYLPSTMTCTNTLFIVEYSSKEALEEKLLQAVREAKKSFHYL